MVCRVIFENGFEDALISLGLMFDETPGQADHL